MDGLLRLAQISAAFRAGGSMRERNADAFEIDFTGTVKAGHQIETWQRRSAAAFTAPVILFIALPEWEDKADPG